MAEPILQQTQDTVQIPLYDVERGGIMVNQQILLNCIAMRLKSGVSANSEVVIEQREGFQPYNINYAGLTAIAGANCQIVAAINLSQKSDLIAVVAMNSTFTTFWFLTVNPSAGAAATWTNLGSGACAASDKMHLSEYTTRVVAPTSPGLVTPCVVLVQEKSATNASKIFYSLTFLAGSMQDLTATAAAPWNTSWANYTWVGPAVELNGRLYIMSKNGYIMCSDLGSIANWTESSFVPCEAYPDNGVGLCRYKHMLIAFGQESMEFFADVGNTTGAPIQRTDQAFIKMGTWSSQTYLNVDDILYWLSASSTGGFQFWKLDGYTPVKISDSGLENVMQTAPNTARLVKLRVATLNGRRHIFTFIPFYTLGNSYPWVFNLSEGTLFRQDFASWHGNNYIDSSSPTWVYNVTDNTWWLYGLGLNNAAYEFFPCPNNYDNSISLQAKTYCLFVNGFTSYLNGILDTNGPGNDVAATAGASQNGFPCMFALNPIRFGNGKRKFMHKLRFFTELYLNNLPLGTSAVGNPASFILCISDTNGDYIGSMASSSRYLTSNITQFFDSTKQQVYAFFNQQIIFRKLGAFRNRTISLAWISGVGTSGTHVRITGCEADLTQGVS